LSHLNNMSRFFLAIALLGSLAACGNGTPASTSPGVKLVQNAAASGLPTIVEFGAVGCASCREMKIVLDSVVCRTQGRANVLNIDISKDMDAADAYRIQLIPTQVFFDAHGNEIERHMGILTEAGVIARLGLSDTSK
jgi:thioredoxin 1